MLYVFDTSSLIVLQGYYPERFPSFWAAFNDLVVKEQVTSVREVREELDDYVSKAWYRNWIEKNKAYFLTPTAEESAFVSEIFLVDHFQTLVSRKKQLSGGPVADPWVIACAKVRGGCVVTEESEKPNAAKIPNVCDHFGIDCTDLEGFLEQLGWQF